MTELKKAQRFDDQLFEASQPSSQPPKLAPAESFDNQQFSAQQIVETTAATPAKSRKEWLWPAALGSMLLFSVVQWGAFLQQSWQSGWFQGGLVTTLTVLAAGLLLRFGWREWRYAKQFRQRQDWRLHCQNLAQGLQYGEADGLCQQITAQLPPEYIAADLALFQQQHKIEMSDAETLKLYELTVLQRLDQSVELQIKQAATQTGVAVALSPFALADLILVLWRSSLMLKEIAALYGTSPGILRRGALLKKFLHTLFWTGASELAVDLGTDLLGAELGTKISARVGQGVLAGVMVARLGRYAQQQLRPLPLAISQKSQVKFLLSDLVKKLIPDRTAN